MDIVKIAIIGIVSAILALQFKGLKAEYGIYISLAAGIIIFGFAISHLDTIIQSISTINGYITADASYLGVLVKIMGIAYICEFASGLCKDSGHSAIASQIEMFGKLSILVISLPVLMALLDTIDGFLN